MEDVNCSRCNRRLSGKWNYCPFCGGRIKSPNPFKNFFKMFDDIARQFREESVTDSPDEGRKTFSVQITDLNGEPKIKVADLTGAGAERRELKHHKHGLMVRKPHANVEEPKTLIKKAGDSFFIEINVPDVKDIRDVEILSFKESIEIRAHARNKTYLKLIATGNEKQVVRKELVDGKLFMEIN